MAEDQSRCCKGGWTETAAGMREDGIQKGQRVEVTISNCCLSLTSESEAWPEGSCDWGYLKLISCICLPQIWAGMSVYRGTASWLRVLDRITLSKAFHLGFCLAQCLQFRPGAGGMLEERRDMTEPRIQSTGPLLWEINQDPELGYTSISSCYFPLEETSQRAKECWQSTNTSLLCIWFSPKRSRALIVQKGTSGFFLRHWVLMSNTLRQYVVDIFSMQLHLIWWLRIFLWSQITPGLTPWLCHFLAMCPWTSSSTSLSLNFLIFKIFGIADTFQRFYWWNEMIHMCNSAHTLNLAITEEILIIAVVSLSCYYHFPKKL